MNKTNDQACTCQSRIKAAINTEPSAGHDYVDEIIGLLRVTRGQRDDAERRCLTSAGGRQPEPPKTAGVKALVSATGSAREAFEKWITAPPYEREIARWPQDETKYAWPGQYQDIAVQLAWESWMEAPNTVISDDSAK
jgi:hypothetical protein